MMKDQAEKLREIIKQNTEEIVKDCNAHIITVTSGKGGVGKSNVSVNLGLELLNKGKRVLIIDADLGLANVEVLMNVWPTYSLSDVINGNKLVTEVIAEGSNGIKFISGGSGIKELANVSEEKLRYFAQNLSVLDEMFDVIIIDTGAGISETVMTFAKIANQILLVTTSDPTALTDAYALLKVLTKEMPDGAPNVKVIVNMVRNMNEAYTIFNNLNKVCEKFLDKSLEVIEYLPDDISLGKAVKMQRPVTIEFPKSEISLALKRLASRVGEMLSNEVEIEDITVKSSFKGLRGLLNSFIKR